MVQLSLLEEIKDKASRLIPTAYMEIVEECTAPHLLIPTYEHVKFLCETVNKKPDTIVDVVRALRRRIADNNVAVKHLTVQLLESMIKNSATAFHIEVASQKGLLRDLVNIACMQPTTGRAMQAKEAARLLTLNLSIWFRGHPAEECYILTTLADDVRNQLGPNCFEGIEPERNTRLWAQVSAPHAARANSRADPRVGNSRSGADRAGKHRRERRNIVDAIPINFPSPERISAMLDVCMTFSEYLNNAAMDADKPLMQDEVVQSYQSQVAADHDYVTLLLSSNLQLDRDILRTVSDSQSAVFKKVEEIVAQKTGRTAAPRPLRQPQQNQQQQFSADPISDVRHMPVRSAVDTESTPQDITASRATPPRAEVAEHGAPAPVPPPWVPAPSVDELFGDVTAGATPISPSNAVAAPAPLPSSAAAPVLAQQSGTTPSSVGRSMPSPQSLNPSMPFPSQSASADAPAAVHTDPAPSPAAEEEQKTVPVEPAGKEKEERGTLKTEEVATPVKTGKEHDEKKAEAKVAPAAPAVPAAVSNDNDDDFDAFLDGRI